MRFQYFHFLPLSTALPSTLFSRQNLPDIVNPLLQPVSKLFDPVVQAVESLHLPASSILNPFLDTTSQVLSGQGFVPGVLGPIAGVLGEDLEYDYVVIGGGTAGNAIATRLAQSHPNTTVAIIESGLYYELAKPVLGATPAGAFFGVGWSMLDQVPTVDWGFRTEPQDGAAGRRMHYARGKCLGGSSALNFMIHHRGSKGSYDMWAEEVGDDSYTLSNLWKYFQRSVNLTPPDNSIRRANATTLYDANAFAPEGEGGPVQVGYTNWVAIFSTWLEQALKSVGMERTTGFSSGELLGYHYSQSTIRASDQSRSASDQYLRLVKDAPNLKVYTQTHAQKILFNSAKRATGVRVSSLGLPYTIHARREVILSAGTFQSPQLLMVSGIGDPSSLSPLSIPIISPLKGVGQNMWDHVMFGPTHEVTFPTVDAFLHNPAALTSAAQQYISSPPQGPLTSNVAEFLGWEKLPDKYRQQWSPSTRAEMASFPSDWPEVEHISGNGYIGDFWFPVLQQPLNDKQYATILGALVAPTSRGNVTITSTDTGVLPKIHPNWMSTKTDQEVAVSWYKRMREVWASAPLHDVSVQQPNGDYEYFPGSDKSSDEDILQVIRESLMTVWHAAGTCKMGKGTDEMAVVDRLGRVFGVEGLRVVDASVFPVLPPGHPQSTVYALAEKIAEDVIEGRE